MADTAIEWADVVWNPTTGCNDDVVSPGCERCYARRKACGPLLRGKFGYPADEPFRVTLHPDRLDAPLHWRKPRRVFVDSMGDLFHEDVPDEFLDEVFGRILAQRVLKNQSDHEFLVLTKRPERMLSYMSAPVADLLKRWALACDGRVILDDADVYFSELVEGYTSHTWNGRGAADSIPHEPWQHPNDLWPLPNLWLGVTAEDQDLVDERLEKLRRIPAAVRFVSGEPMLSPIWIDPGYMVDIDWVICGAETGPGARPMDPAWARDLLAQCRAARVPFFFKKAGPRVETPPDLAVREWPEPKGL